MYIVMESQFDYSVLSTFQHAVSSSRLYFVLCTKMKYKQQFQHDMPVLRRWWCLLLLENNSLNSCGKIFAHWTEECKQLIAGKHTPVFRLKRKAEQQDIEETMTQMASDVRRMCMAESMQFCVYQTSNNTGERLLYPEVKLIKWVQCKTCRGWLHQDCAGMEMEPFDCGCEDSIEHPRIKDAVDSGGIHAVFSKTQIKTLHDDLLSGKLRSNRMFLWRNPATSLRLKQHLKIRTLSWSEQRVSKNAIHHEYFYSQGCYI
ncbi:uncharacterized protein LOC126401090 [Xyrichtys novacula]|uniref:Uncharacterized protein LOC126401090 n=1 Tax=Xyrichtys novacula TaxID=13765 RepID=A0AAV1HAT1_XYRNO|nr:uncharacterized protein LOC126401090 [Xyrichtys novacula]